MPPLRSLKSTTTMPPAPSHKKSVFFFPNTSTPPNTSLRSWLRLRRHERAVWGPARPLHGDNVWLLGSLSGALPTTYSGPRSLRCPLFPPASSITLASEPIPACWVRWDLSRWVRSDLSMPWATLNCRSTAKVDLELFSVAILASVMGGRTAADAFRAVSSGGLGGVLLRYGKARRGFFRKQRSGLRQRVGP